MISRIKGVLLEKQTQEVLVDVRDIAYEILVPLQTLFMLPELGKEVVLYTHFVVREDAQLLYGFYDAKSRSLFRILIKINGVGPKMALSILSGIDVNDFVATVHNNDVNSLVRIPGVGKKTAERLIIEVRDKLEAWETEPGNLASPGENKTSTQGGSVREAERALLSLGYKPQEANKAVNAASKILGDDDQIIDSEALIRLALKNMI